jgi:hypothetical protein
MQRQKREEEKVRPRPNAPFSMLPFAGPNQVNWAGYLERRMEMSQWDKSARRLIALLVLFWAGASWAEAAILDDSHARSFKLADGSRYAQPAPSKGVLASTNVLAGGIGATLTLLSLGTLGYTWRRHQKTPRSW